MTLHFFQPSKQKRTEKSRYYVSQFDGDTYQVVDSVENREVCVCSNYDDWQDAEERARRIVTLLNNNMQRIRKKADITCQWRTSNMKVKDLINLLSRMPAEADVIVKGYEGGMDDVINVKLAKIKKDTHTEWHYGRHEIDEDGDVQAVFIQREERQSEQ